MASNMKKVLPRAVAVVVVLGAAATAYLSYLREPAPEPAPPPVITEPEPAPEPTVVPPATDVPLPALEDSDAPVKEWLSEVIGPEAVVRFLVPDSVVRKLVATVDNLPRKKLDLRVRAVRQIEAPFQTEHDGGDLLLGPATYARYEQFMQVAGMVDADKAADLYARLYPLLQGAYEELGYPGRQFHVRMLAAIDDALAAPEIGQRVRLVQPHAFYEFADADLEDRSAGQKILMRIGPQHAAVIKEKLKAFRAAIVARSTAADGPHAGTPSSLH